MTNAVFDSSVSHHTREVYTDIFRDFFNSQEFLLVTKTVVHPTTGEKHKSGLGFSNFEKFTEHFLQFSSELCVFCYEFLGVCVVFVDGKKANLS